MYDIAIIGAGVVGAAIARELSRYQLKLIVVDKGNDVCAGTSKANSSIVHAGYDPEPGTLMAKLNSEGNPMFDKLCKELSVPFNRCGSFVVAFTDEQVETLKVLLERGKKNGIPGLEIVDVKKLLEKEPAASPDAKAALYAPTAGVVDPMLLTTALMENAVMNGADYKLNYKVDSIEKTAGGYIIHSDAGDIEAGCVINAAGVYSDIIHNMVAAPDFSITPKIGQYFLLDKSENDKIQSVLFPCPDKNGKGILVARSVHGNVILGPTSDVDQDRDDTGTTDEALNRVRQGCSKLVPTITTRNCIRNFAGMRAEPSTGDFIIREVQDAPKFIDVAGIKSPGLSAAPAIALYVVDIVKNCGIRLEAKKDFNPIVKRTIFMELSPAEQAALVKKDPRYGRIICRCERITEGEIVDEIHRPIPAVTLDAIKRRCRPGMGRCQGGFCGPKVHEILARELGCEWKDIVLDKKGSYILTGKTK